MGRVAEGWPVVVGRVGGPGGSRVGTPAGSFNGRYCSGTLTEYSIIFVDDLLNIWFLGFYKPIFSFP